MVDPRMKAAEIEKQAKARQDQLDREAARLRQETRNLQNQAQEDKNDALQKKMQAASGQGNSAMKVKILRDAAQEEKDASKKMHAARLKERELGTRIRSKSLEIKEMYNQAQRLKAQS